MLPKSRKPQIIRLHSLQDYQRERFASHYLSTITDLFPSAFRHKLFSHPVLKNLIPDLYFTYVTICVCRKRLGEEYTYVTMCKDEHYEHQGVLVNKKYRTLVFVLQILGRNFLKHYLGELEAKIQSRLQEPLLKAFFKCIGTSTQILSNIQWIMMMLFMLNITKSPNFIDIKLGLSYVYTFQNESQTKIIYKFEGLLLLSVFIIKLINFFFNLKKEIQFFQTQKMDSEKLKSSEKMSKKEGNGQGFNEGSQLCRICYDQISQKSCTKCGHVFCWQCIIKSLEFNPQCPFGSGLGLLDKKKSSDQNNGTDLFSSLLSATKNTPKPIVEEASKPKKKQEDPEDSHEYLKRALKPLKPTKEKPVLFKPKNQSKEVVYKEKIKEAKAVMENKDKQKKYKPKVVDYLNVGDWSNFKKDGQDKPKPKRPEMEKSQKQKYQQKRRYSPSPENAKKSQERHHKQKLQDKEKQSRIVEQDRSEKFRQKQEERQRQREKQREKARAERQRERSREKQRERAKDKEREVDRERQRQKQRERTKQKESQHERNYERQKREKQRKQRQYERERRFKEHKKKRHQDSDSYEDDGFIVDDQQEQQDWKHHMKKILNTDKRQKIYRIRDRQEIVESTARQILGEDRISARYGKEEEEADWRREEEERRRRAEKKKREEEKQRRH